MQEYLDFEKISIVGVMTLAVIGAMRGWWVAGVVYRREVDRADHWETIASRAVAALERLSSRRDR